MTAHAHSGARWPTLLCAPVLLFAVPQSAPPAETEGTGGGASLDNIASGTNAFVGGGFGNTASGVRASIAGGRGNSATQSVSTVGGGKFNQATGDFATIAGGSGNGALRTAATVGGGSNNTASENFATVSGGGKNQASGPFSTVAGGSSNEASGGSSMVIGGSENRAEGPYSCASGRMAHAKHRGAFVWGDSQNYSKVSSAVDQVTFFASGGARIFTSPAATVGVSLAPGSGAWSLMCDRDAKQNFEAVDGRDVLRRVVDLPIASWSYRTQDASIRHMGPSAQDFRAAFGLGLDERHIDSIDLDGVAFAAIQGLHAELAERTRELDSLRGRVRVLEGLAAEVAALRAELALGHGTLSPGGDADEGAGR